MTRVALTGGAYEARSLVAAAQRCVNLYVEPIPEAQGEPATAAHFLTPGTRLLGTIGPGPVRGIRQSTLGGVYVVSGSGVYSVDPSTWAGTLLGTITPGLTTPVSMADNGLDMVIVDGTAGGWRITLADNSFAPIIQTATIPAIAGAANDAVLAGRARYTPFTAPIDGRVTTLVLTLVNGYAGQMKCGLFAEDFSTVLGTADVVTNPATGPNLFNFANSVPVTKGTNYWVGFDSDTTAGTFSIGAGTTGRASTTPFATFPLEKITVTATNPLPVQIPLQSDPGGIFSGADRVDYLDTYFLFNKPNTPQFYSSDSLALTFDPLWFANKESYSDILRTIVVAKRDILLIGDKTTEIWANVGKPDFPFEGQPGVFVDHGIVAKYSVAEYDNGAFWLTADRQGQGIVVMCAGYQTKRISTYAIEAEIAGYARIDDAIGFCYQLAGHTYYVLTFPAADRTWAHDITTGHWHEWLWIDTNGAEHRHRANCYWPINGTPVIGDWRNGNLYALDLAVFTDNGGPIKRVRTYPHMVADGKRVFYRQFLADFDTGSPSDAGVSGSERLISLRWSNDRGHSYGNPVLQPIGDVGDYLTSLQWQRLGMARDRVWELSWTAPMPCALLGAWIDATPAMS